MSRLWFAAQVCFAALLTALALALGWYVTWKLILSKFSFFQEIFGMRSARALQLAQLRKRKQQAANTFVLTRSGEQLEKHRERMRNQQAVLRNQPTTTPFPPSTPSSAAAAAAFSAVAASAVPVLLHPAFISRRRRGRSGSGSGATPAFSMPGHAQQKPSALSNSDPAALAAEALLRRNASANSLSSSISSSSATPLPPSHPHSQRTPLSSSDFPSLSQQSTRPGSPRRTRGTAGSATPTTTIGGSGWLQRAAIIEDYAAPPDEEQDKRR